MRRLILLLVSIPQLSLTDELPDPFTFVQLANQGKYLEAIQELEGREDAYLKSEKKFSYLQAMATALSYVGKYKEAQKYFDSGISLQMETDIPQDLSLFEAKNAVKTISDMASQHQVIMINEAHHVPETRALTFALLKPLYDQGYRYLAAETFNEEGVREANKLKFPTRRLGYYTAEPLFNDIARAALKIGFELVAYEHKGECDYKKDPEGCQDKREREQANNLIERILKNNPKAKIIVHAGYGHIDETGVTKTFPWIPMAKYFKEFSGIDPLTIDQLTFRTRGKPEAEDKNYRPLVKHFALSGVKEPVVIKENNANSTIWTGMPGHYDIQVILPVNSIRSRPIWVAKLFNRVEAPAPWESCSGFPCLIKAVALDEEKNEWVAVDQVLANDKKDLWDFILPDGKFYLRYEN